MSININNQFAHINAYYGLNLDEFNMPVHSHNRYEIMYVVSGVCEITIAESVFKLKQRQFIFIDENIPHRLTVKKGEPCVLLNLEFACNTVAGSNAESNNAADLKALSINSSAFLKFISADQEYLILEDNQKVCFAMKDLIDELEKGDYKDYYLLNILFLRLLIEISNCFESRNRFTGYHYVKKAKEFINENFQSDISVEMIANFVNINHSYLQTLFSKNLNCGIMAYVNSLRLDKACFLLKNSSMSVTDIAFSIGFNSRQHFGYSFEKRFNKSPSKYRERMGQNIMMDTATFKLV